MFTKLFNIIKGVVDGLYQVLLFNGLFIYIICRAIVGRETDKLDGR